MLFLLLCLQLRHSPLAFKINTEIFICVDGKCTLRQSFNRAMISMVKQEGRASGRKKPRHSKGKYKIISKQQAVEFIEHREDGNCFIHFYTSYKLAPINEVLICYVITTNELCWSSSQYKWSHYDNFDHVIIIRLLFTIMFTLDDDWPK